MNPLLRANIRKEERWSQRKLVKCELCGVRVLSYDAARHAAHHEREAKRVSSLRKEVSKLEAKRKRGRPKKDTTLGRLVGFRLESTQHLQLLAVLEGTGKTPSEWIRELIFRELNCVKQELEGRQVGT